MKRILLCCVAAIVLACSGTPARESKAPTPLPRSPAQQMDAALDDLWALDMKTFPGWATYEGVRDYDDELEDVSTEAREEYVRAVEAIAERVEQIDPAALDPLDRDTRQMVMLKAEQRRANLVCKMNWWDVNGLGGPQVDYLMMPVFFSIRGDEDLANLEERYRATDRQVAQIEAHLREGVRNGYAPTEIGRELGLPEPTAEIVIEHFSSGEDSYAETSEELVEKNAAVMRRAQAAMPRAFGRLPKTPIEMREIEAHRASAAPAAYYYSAPSDGSRPAYYYVNSSEPQTRPLYNLEALAFHEAIPGHHQQIALAKEIPDMHVWRRNAGQTAFVEGWALYAEMLADELGLYSDAVTRFGMYNYQAWRAARLVIDTGLHHKGWTRAQAIDFLAANTALPQSEVENEVDRYIAWPGQALAYMVGRMKIMELRNESRQVLGDAFSLRAFHDAVNANGAVPLTILEENITDWRTKMAEKTAHFPKFKELWDFSDPAGLLRPSVSAPREDGLGGEGSDRPDQETGRALISCQSDCSRMRSCVQEAVWFMRSSHHPRNSFQESRPSSTKSKLSRAAATSASSGSRPAASIRWASSVCSM